MARDASYHPWSSRMVAELDLVCRSLVPPVPELDLHFLRNRVDYDYDFVHERQIIADYDQYWETKHRLRSCTPSSPVLECQASPDQIPTNPSTVDRESTSVKSVTSANATPIPPHILSSSTHLPRLPLAARDMQFGEILKPCKTEIKPNPTPPSITQSNDLCVSDFDRIADDPFTVVELKSINELEELRHILSTSCTTQASSPHFSSPTGQMQIASSLPFLHRPPEIARTFTSASSSHHAASNFPRPVSVIRPMLSNSGTDMVASRYLSSRQPPTSFRMPFSSSVPNIQVSSIRERSKSASRLDSRIDLSKISSVSAPSFGLTNSRSATALNAPLDEASRRRALLDWVKQSDFSEGRARQLIELPHNKLRLFTVPLEDAQRNLSDQLRLISLLLSEYSIPQYKTNLSERSAIIAASSFPNNWFQARQFAKVTLELEQYGHSQRTTQSYLLNSRLDHDASLSQLISTFLHLSSSSRAMHQSSTSHL